MSDSHNSIIAQYTCIQVHLLKGLILLAVYNVIRHSSDKKDIFRIYKSPIYSGFSSRKITKTKKNNNIINRQKSNSRAKRRIQELISLNFQSEFTFMTLTFKENVKDITVANKTFSSFLKRLKYYFRCKKNINLDFKYISILETQKRGAIHFHIICNIPIFTNFKDVINLWQKSIQSNNKIEIKGGSVRIKYSDGHEIEADKLGFYLTKYLTKTYNNPEFCGKKIYSTSRNLIQYNRSNYFIKFNELSEEQILKKLNLHFDLDTSKPLFLNTYSNPYTLEDIYYIELEK